MSRVEMDRVMNSRFQFEATEDMQSLLGTVTDDVLHDQVGNPLGPWNGKEEMVHFYEALSDDTEAGRRYSALSRIR